MAANGSPVGIAEDRDNNAPLTPSPLATLIEKATKAEPKSASSLKRKATDPSLKIITIDPYYDLTLIVGEPHKRGGQTAFQVNKGSLRHASDVWTKMLNGDWAESNQSEIRFPDDHPWPFEQALRIAHLQIAQLPANLSIAQTSSLAVMTDKYNLKKIMRIALDSKHWFADIRQTIWREWPAHPLLPRYTYITHVFELQDDYDHLVSKLAVEVWINMEDGSVNFGSDVKTKLSSSLPDRITSQ